VADGIKEEEKKAEKEAEAKTKKVSTLV